MRTKDQKLLLTRLLAAITLIAALSPAMAQRILNTPLTAPLTVQDGTYIILAPGFSTNGFNFQASIGVSYADVTPSPDKNYIIGTTYNTATTSGVVTQAADLHRDIQYFDGLGRPMQNVSVQASPNGRDIVTPIGYDDFGREDTKYLPYALTATNNGTFVINDKDKSRWTTNYGSAEDGYAFAKTDFEASPLNRVLRQGAPGAAWQPNADAANDHSVKLGYDTNTGSEVKRWTVVNDVLTDDGFYAAATLYKTVTWDENNDQTSGTASHTEEFKDLQGKVVLKIATDGANKLYTYYVYDDFELLRFVLPPKAIENNNLVLNKLDSICYHYRYDSRNRMIQKKVTNSWGWTYMVYDQRDRLVATQDMVMRTFNPANGRWLITKYDQLNRPVMTASKALGDSRETLQAYFDTYPATSPYYETRDGSNVGYTMGDSFGTKLSLSESDLLSVSYYDTYDYQGVKAFDNSVRVSDYSDGDATPYYFDRIKGMTTGSRVKVLDGTENNASGYRWLVSTSYYDDRYRAIQTLRDLYTTDATYYEAASTRYDFVGKVMQTKQAQTVNSVTTTIDKYLTYDHAGRLTTTGQLIEGDATGKVTVSENSYNEIGQLVDKKLHKAGSFDYLQSVDYTYNIRGWLTSINNPDNLSGDLFGERLLYESTESGLNSQQFNGNISGMVWNSTQKSKQGYGFTYDGLNRLTSGDHKSYATAWVDDNNYEEKSLTYDNNGNIKHLVRTDGLGNISADYHYRIAGNVLSNINGGGYYNYDANMNTTVDGLRGVSIAYNILNLPKLVSKGTDNIAYIYSAAGEKLAKRMKDGTYQYYAGNMVYKNDKSLNYLSFEEGLVNKVSGGYAYEYHLKDHLGNTRVTFQPNGNTTTTTQVAEYYPFGSSYLPISPAGTNKYLYNGKEKQDDVLGGMALDWYDYGARMYDPQIGRFHTQDAFAEKYINFTPYQYGANNPIKNIDINGDSIQATSDAILAIYHALDKNAHVKFGVKNGMIDPESIKDQAASSDDIVLKDLYEIASNKQTVEMSVSDNYDFFDNDGNSHNTNDKDQTLRKFNIPFDFNTHDEPEAEKLLIKSGDPIGHTFQGSTGRTLFPGKNSTTGANSTNGHIQLILNANGNLNHRAIGSAHEFGHVVLYLRGLPHGHGEEGVDKAIYQDRENVVKKRLGYDF